MHVGRIGNLLGEGFPLTARKSGWLCVALGGIFMSVCAVVIIGAWQHARRLHR